MSSRNSVLAATLAVGTELTDGQVVNRNSAWISQKLAQAGIELIEHRTVPDDRETIERSLLELAWHCDLLFVTGGLGPTSDDFTRDLLASAFDRPLEFSADAWKRVQEKLAARGIEAREIQKQQCYFPRGSRLLANSAGTAEGFFFRGEANDGTGRRIGVYALPGPPGEIAAIWAENLLSEIDSMVSIEDRAHLSIFRCLGRGESDIAEVAEAALKGSTLRIGYRAHAPYVEVKIWCRPEEMAKASPYLSRLEKDLGQWLVGRDDEDLADAVIDILASGGKATLIDEATGGLLQERVTQRLRERKLSESVLPLSIETRFAPSAAAGETFPSDTSLGFWAALGIDPGSNVWTLRMKTREGHETELEVRPPYNYKLHSERARKYFTERAFLEIRQMTQKKPGGA